MSPSPNDQGLTVRRRRIFRRYRRAFVVCGRNGPRPQTQPPNDGLETVDGPTAGSKSSGEQYTYRTRQVDDRCMARLRINIEIEDEYVLTIMRR